MNRNFAVGLLIALLLHGAVAFALSRAGRTDRTRGTVSLVEVDVTEPPPPPPPPAARPEPPPPPAPEPEPEPPPPAPEPPPPAPEPAKPAPEPRKPEPPPAVDFGEVDVSDVSDDSFAEDGAWEITNRPDNPEGGSGVIVVGADNRPPAVAPPPPPPPPVPRAPVGSSGGGTGTGPGTGRRAPEFRPETDVSRPPEVDEEIRADYPEEARRDGIQGAVRLLVMIRKDGTVYRVRVLEDPGGGLGDAAKRALERFRFRPAVGRNGDPVDYQITYTYRFVLDS